MKAQSKAHYEGLPCLRVSVVNVVRLAQIGWN